VPLDKLKNYWGWSGFTTRDLKRCRFMARLTALVYSWWSLFVRLADLNQHTEAITSRPLLLHAPHGKPVMGDRAASPSATPTPRWPA
jgi:hypothetical protein